MCIQESAADFFHVSLLCFLQDDERLERAIEFAQRKGVLPVSATRKDALVKFYEKHDTAKIPDIDKMLTQHKYEDILKAMMKKYGEVPEDPQSATRKVALIRFYEKHDPSKIKDVDVLLRKHKYEAVVKSLKAKYGDVPGAETVESMSVSIACRVPSAFISPLCCSTPHMLDAMPQCQSRQTTDRPLAQASELARH